MNRLGGAICWVVAAASLVTGGGCTFGAEVEGQGEVAPTGQAVGTGKTDGTNSYNYAGALQFPGQTAPFCSGVLITPVWVATANHCITGSESGVSACLGLGTPSIEPGAGINGQLHVTFDYSPMAVGTVPYTPQNQNPRFVTVPPHAVRMSSAVDWCHDSEREDDLALLKLAARVPQTIAVPRHPPGILGTPECPGSGDEFYGLLVGYGNKTLWLTGTDDNRERNYAFEGEYKYEDHLYRNIWLVPPWALFSSAWYTGGLGGDSGAPLFQVSTAQLCGLHVTHEVFFDVDWLFGFIPIVLLEAESNAVALDFDENQNFIQNRVVDSRGVFMGECGNLADPNAPTALSDIDSDGDYIPDACDPCPEVPDPMYQATGTLAPAMTPGGAGDDDKDGIPDVCDLCPQHGKVLGDGRQLVGGVFRQPDADGDGLADACDDQCPSNSAHPDLVCCDPAAPGTTCDVAGATYPWSNRCFAIAPQTAAMASISCPLGGRCGEPIDFDSDDVPDACDNCPGTLNGQQKDSDQDGAGDACDNCPGKHDFGPQPSDRSHFTCVPGDPVQGDALCEGIASGGRCAPVQPTGGICTKQRDTDGDGVGESCDNCRLVANSQQKNCNIDIERSLNVAYPFIGDACDRTPCTRLFKNAAYIESANDLDNMWAAISYNPMLLPEGKVGPSAENNAFTYSAKPLADVGGRHCDCSPVAGISLTNMPTAWACRSRCALSAALYNPAPGNTWLPVSLAASMQAPPLPPLPALVTSLGMERPLDLAGEPQVPELPDKATTFLSWSLTADGAKDFSWFFNSPLTKGLLDVYWGHVQGVTQLDAAQSNCATGVPDCYRPRSNSYAAGFFGVTGGKTVFQVGATEFNSCFWCAKEPCPHCQFWKETGNLLVQPATAAQPAKVVLHSNQYEIDLTASFAPALVGGMLDQSSKWITVAEREHFPQRGAVLASLAGDGTAAENVFAMQGGVVSAVHRRSEAARLSPRDAPHPAARREFGAVLSATEQSVFLFGGTALLGGPPADAAALWIHDWEKDSWHPTTLRGAIPGRVLAATFRVEDRSLYAIDEVQLAGRTMARLLRIRLADQRSTVLALFSRSPKLARVDLVPAPDGRLLLVGSFSSPAVHRAALFQPGDGRVERVLWTLAGSGPLAAEPNLTENGLTLPLSTPGAPTPLTNRFVATPELPAGQTFALAKCF